MARKRPMVSDAVQPELTSLQAPDSRPFTRHSAVATEELLSIVIRASQLGYCPWRVGIALRVAPTQLTWICARLNEPHAPTAKAVTAALAARTGDLPQRSRIEHEAARGMTHDQRL